MYLELNKMFYYVGKKNMRSCNVNRNIVLQTIFPNFIVSKQYIQVLGWLKTEPFQDLSFKVLNINTKPFLFSFGTDNSLMKTPDKQWSLKERTWCVQRRLRGEMISDIQTQLLQDFQRENAPASREYMSG